MVLRSESEDLKWDEVMLSIAEIRKAYNRINSQVFIAIINYNIRRYRFAYIYLYAVCHTSAVWEQMNFLEENRFGTFREIMKFQESLRLCCLGGGPGCELIGILCGLENSVSSSIWRGPSTIDCTVLDMCFGWNLSLNHALVTFLESDLCKNYSSRISFNFVQSNLCSDLNPLAICAIKNADLITMVKFFSVVSFYFKNDSCYLQMIFKFMKSGSFLFFLDNSAGGFYEMVSEEAMKNNLIPIFLRKTVHRVNETSEFFNYGIPHGSLKATSLIFAIWKKN